MKRKRRSKKSKRKKRKVSKSSELEAKKRKLRIAKERPENEYELQVAFNNWYRSKYKYDVTCGTPYEKRSIRTAQISKNKGYIAGYPDYTIHDPRFSLSIDPDTFEISIKIFHGVFIEFKTPTGKGRLSKAQKLQKQMLESRSYLYCIIDDLKAGKDIIRTYKKNFMPMTNSNLSVIMSKNLVNLIDNNYKKQTDEQELIAAPFSVKHSRRFKKMDIKLKKK